MRFYRKARFLWVYPLAVWLVLTAHTSEGSLRTGLVIILCGEIIRLWANGYVGHVKVNWTEGGPKIGRLITAGPYAFVRHPLYFGTFLVGLGFCVIVGNMWLGVVALGGFVLLYPRKMTEEEATILHEWGEGFARYHRAVPRWLPLRGRYPHREGAWSWQGIAASKELKTVAWVGVAVIGLYFREELLQRREPLLGPHTLKHALLLALMILLVLIDVLSELLHRARRTQPRPSRLPAT